MTSSPLQWYVAQLGARQHYAVPRALEQRGCLQAFYTDAWCRAGQDLLRHGPSLVRAFANRRHDDLPPGRVVSWNAAAVRDGLQRAFAERSGDPTRIYQHHVDVGRRFATTVARELASRDLEPDRDAFFGFSTGALETLEFLQGRGVRCVLDQISPGPADVVDMIDEAKRWPGWQKSPPYVHPEHAARLQAEWQAASLVLVNSPWSRDWLVRQGVPAAKIIVVPIAYERPVAAGRALRRRTAVTQVLWAGAVTLRKGIQYLMAAARALEGENVVFTIAGGVEINESFVARAPRNMEFLGQCPRDVMTRLYQSADLFVFPTLSDGFGITQLEAMAHGLPVIATPNCGEVVEHGRSGLLVPARDASALAAAIQRLVRDHDLLDEMSQGALERVRQFTLARYAENLVSGANQAWRGAVGAGPRRVEAPAVARVERVATTTATNAEPRERSWIVAQLGAREHYAVPRALRRHGQLDVLYTDAWCRRGQDLLRRGPRMARAFANRHHPELRDERVISWSPSALREAVRRGADRWSNDPHAYFRHHVRVGREFATTVAEHMRGRALEPDRHAFFGFSTGSLETLIELRRRGVPTIVDQISPGRSEIEQMIEEYDRWPGWQKSLPVIDGPYVERLQAEWEAASLVLVNSEWSRHWLVVQGVPADKVIVVPLAYESPARAERRPPVAGRKRVALWAGAVSLRKGIQYLYQAAHRLAGDDLEVVVAGAVDLNDEIVRNAPVNMRFLGQCPRDVMQRIYAEADFFVFPTLSDGFGITQIEAMAQGLPVIATPNCGAVVEDGVNGLIVPARDGEALADAMRALATNTDTLQRMSQAALLRVQDFTLQRYAETLFAAAGAAWAAPGARPQP